MPAADSRPTINMDCSILSPDSVTCDGSPEVSSAAFDAQPPDLPPLCLVNWASLSFASSPHTVGLLIRFLFIGSRF